ncbi:MAG: PAS domain S-box protein [Leptolyngbyaceae cyanobacterium bins.349]|nr:PAS domain S-box protein [Leptolyngbyaceae cyanobacterium bins.349]
MSAQQHLSPSASTQKSTAANTANGSCSKLLDTIPGMIYQFRLATDGTMSFPYVSAGCQTVFQIEAEALLADANCLIGRLHPDDRAAFEASVMHSAKTLTPWKWEGRFQASATATVWIEAASQPESLPNGEILWSGILMDVTRRKQAEIAVQKLSQTLEQRTVELDEAIARLIARDRFFDISQDLMCLIGFDGFFKQLNPQWAVTLGFSLAELQAKPFIEFVHPEDRAATLAEAEKITQGVNTLSFENRYIGKDGSVRWLQWQVVPIVEQAMMYASARDVSDRKATEYALAESEMRFRGIIESAFDMIFQMTAEGKFSYVSPNFRDYFGYAPEELQGQHFMPLVHPDDVGICQAALMTLLTTGEKQTGIEYRALHQDGTISWHTTSIALLQNSDITTPNVIGFARDITERKQAEALLATQKRTLRAILDNAPIWIWMTDNRGKMQVVNRTFCEDVGISEAQFLAASHYKEILGEEASQNCMASDAACHAQETPHASEEILPFVDGTLHHLEILKAKVRDEQGNTVGLIGLGVDASDRKQAEEALRQKEAQYRAIFEATSDGVIVTDLETGQTIQANAVAASMLGYSYEEFIQLHPTQYIHPDDHAVFQEFLNTVRAGGIFRVETRDVCKDGSIIDIEVTGSLCLYNGKPHALASVRDVTERKAVELEQKRLIAIIEASSDFIGIANMAGQPLFLNTAGQKLVGLKDMEAATARGISDYFLPADVPILEQQILPTVRQQGSWQGEIRFQHFGTGEAIPTDHTIFVAQDPQTGEPLGIATITRDIRDRKAAEMTLRNYADRQALLNQLTNQIRNSLDQTTIIDSALQAIYQRLKLDFCGLIWFLPDADPPMWEIVQAVETANSMPQAMSTHPAALVGPIEETLMTEGIVRIDEVDRYPEPIHRAYLQSIGAKSVIQVRILLQNGQLGLIAATRCQIQPWTDHEVELVQAVAAQLAIALNQATLYTESQQRAQALADALLELQRTQMQMIQSEKMSSLGQLVAGVAHEINNPVNFIYGNLSHANDYIKDLLSLLDLYQQHYPAPIPEILAEIEAIDLEFLKEDLVKLLNSMKVGADRIQTIVASLRTFSRMDEAEKKEVNIHDGIDSTLMILQNRLKARHDRVEIKILKHYGTLPLIECYAGQLNQVFMNILVNAIDALEDGLATRSLASRAPSDPPYAPSITIETQSIGTDWIQIAIADNGTGMPEPIRNRIFDPFYTTKPIGKGTGMGMSISYEIITEKHGGMLTCHSTPGVGTTFIIQVPTRQQARQLTAIAG